MGRKYAKEAFSIGSSQSRQTNQPNQPYAPGPPNQPYNPQQAQQTNVQGTMQPAAPQFYNPQTFGHTPVPTYNPNISGQQAGQVTYAASTTVATAPSLDPLPQSDLTSQFQAPMRPVVNVPPPAPANVGPRHEPPPTSEQGTQTNTQQQVTRGKRPVLAPTSNPSLGSRSPVCSIFQFIFDQNNHNLFFF